MGDDILTPGGQARVYRNGMLQMAVLVPHGRMELRQLSPGDYLIKDEDGNSRELIVSPFDEVVVVQIPEGSEDGPVASAETPHDIDMETGRRVWEDPEPHEELGPHYPDLTAPVRDPEQGVISGEQEGLVETTNRAEQQGLKENLHAMRVEELRREAKRVGVKQSGKKDELRERVLAALEAKDAPELMHSGEATSDEPSAEEQMREQGRQIEPTPEPADGVMDGDRVIDEHHLEGGSSAAKRKAREDTKAAKERARVNRKMGA